MNKIIKFAIASAVLVPALLASSAFAATFSNVEFQNGDVTISGQGGSTVSATFHIIVPAGQVVEYIQTDVVGDGLAPVDTSVGGDLGLQEGTYDQTVQVKLPPNTGTYTLNVQGAGIYGGIRSINGNDNVVGTASFNGSLRVVSDVNGSTDTPVAGSWQAAIAALTAQIAALVHPTSGGTTPPTISAVCAAYAQAASGASIGVNNGSNVRLQGFLLSQGASIPALVAGASFGFYGPQTQAAVSSFQATNHC